MDSQAVFTLGQQGLHLLLLVAAPLLLTVLGVGLVVSIFQAATQINEATLSFVPKMIAAVGPEKHFIPICSQIEQLMKAQCVSMVLPMNF